MTEEQFAQLINRLFDILCIFMPSRSQAANERIYDLLSAITSNVFELSDLLADGSDQLPDGQ